MASSRRLVSRPMSDINFTLSRSTVRVHTDRRESHVHDRSTTNWPRVLVHELLCAVTRAASIRYTRWFGFNIHFFSFLKMCRNMSETDCNGAINGAYLIYIIFSLICKIDLKCFLGTWKHIYFIILIILFRIRKIFKYILRKFLYFRRVRTSIE